jgi:hypothetical protein
MASCSFSAPNTSSFAHTVRATTANKASFMQQSCERRAGVAKWCDFSPQLLRSTDWTGGIYPQASPITSNGAAHRMRLSLQMRAFLGGVFVRRDAGTPGPSKYYDFLITP